MKKPLWIVLAVCLAAGLVVPGNAVAQEEGPGSRIVTATSFHVPFYDRDVVFPFMEEYFLPGIQLNPNVLNSRVLVHNWGSDATMVVIVSEYEDFASIDADCGAPCEEYFEQHPAPEEGDPDYEAFELFAKYYAKHADEIYFTNMENAVVEGRMMGTVGHQEPEDDEM